MDVVCQVCGKKESVAKWQPEYEDVREGKHLAYICPVCQDKIRADAQQERKA